MAAAVVVPVRWRDRLGIAKTATALMSLRSSVRSAARAEPMTLRSAQREPVGMETCPFVQSDRVCFVLRILLFIRSSITVRIVLVSWLVVLLFAPFSGALLIFSCFGGDAAHKSKHLGIAVLYPSAVVTNVLQFFEE